MTKKDKKVAVPFKFIDIETKEFATFEDKYDASLKTLSIEFDAGFQMDFDQGVIGVLTKYSFLQKEELVLKLECLCSFDLHPKFIEKYTNEEGVKVPNNLLTHLLVLSVGTARGIIHVKKPKSMHSLMLPTLNVSELVKEDKVFNEKEKLE